MINAIRDLMDLVFEYLEIISQIDLYLRIKYTEITMMGSALNFFLTGHVGVQGII